MDKNTTFLNEKWYLYNHLVTTFGQPSLIFSLCSYPLSSFFSLYCFWPIRREKMKVVPNVVTKWLYKMLSLKRLTNQDSKAGKKMEKVKTHTKTKTICGHQGFVHKDYSHRRNDVKQPWCCIKGSLPITLACRWHIELELPIFRLDFSLVCTTSSKAHGFTCMEKINHQKKLAYFYTSKIPNPLHKRFYFYFFWKKQGSKTTEIFLYSKQT